jgi:GTPase SAR1 family protein
MQAMQQIRGQHTPQLPMCCVICGPKKVGKSSLAQHMVNDFLQEGSIDAVGMLELDCGQPAWGPPGFVSLKRCTEPQLILGAQNAARPDHSVFVGDVSAEAHPLLYIHAAAKLAALHQRSTQNGALFEFGMRCGPRSADRMQDSRCCLAGSAAGANWTKLTAESLCTCYTSTAFQIAQRLHITSTG